jgi:hypothetical protein
MADKKRKHPVFRLGEVMGPQHQRSYERALEEELHRRFDAVADESLPQSIAALIVRLEPKEDGSGPQNPPHAS